MYGLGSLLGPAAAAWLFARNRPWSELLLIGVPPLLGLSVFAWRGLPPVSGGPDPLAAEAHAAEHRLSWSYRQLLLLLVFALYVGAEVMTSSWLVAYLADARRFEVDSAAPYLTGFFFMMTVTRLLCFWRIRLEWEKRLMAGCLVAAASLFLLGRSGWTLGFALSGVLGPVYPLLLAQMSREFPREAPTLAYWVVTTTQVTLALCNFGMGYFTDHFGIRVAYWVPAVFYALTLAALVPYFATSSTESRPENI
jgi:fucose permease